MNKKYIRSLIIVAAFLILGLTSIASYAYFTATVSGNTNAQDSVITTGQMSLILDDGNQITLNNAIPTSSTTKTFKVKNTGTVATTYDVYLSELLNNFSDKNDLVYTLTSESGCETSTQTIVPSVVGEQSKIVSSCSINPNQEHEYTLNITFIDDNTNQDDNKGKIFSATISLNEYKEFSNIAAQLIAKKATGATDLEYDGVSTLGQNGTADNNLRYIGYTPSNYIYFNCSTTDPSLMNNTTCEKWRIIGLMNNIENESGSKESLIKIRRHDSIGSYAWDSSDESTNSGYGINQWGTSGTYEGADLMRELNTDYLGNITVGTDGYWYNNRYNKKEGSMPATILNALAQSMIETVEWNLGSPNNNNGVYDSNWEDNLTPIYSYTGERADTNGKVCTGGLTCNDGVVRTTTWIGKVGLVYPSDYGYATSGGTTTNKTTCLSTSMNHWDLTDVSDCKNNNWMIDAISNQWTITPLTFSNDARYALRINYTGNVLGRSTDTERAVRPTVFLKTSVRIVSGEGTKASPYKLAI